MASSELVKVDLLQSHFNKKATEQITKWWNGQISGERCAKAVVGGPIGAIAGGVGGAAAGGLAGQAVNRLIQVLR